MSSATGKILVESTDGENRVGVVEFDGKRRSIYLNLVPDAHSGDYVKFRAGFATERVDGSAPAISPSTHATREPEIDIETVRAYRLLGELDPRQLQKLLPLAQEERFAAGQVIFQALAVGRAGGHREVGLEGDLEPALEPVGLVEVLDQLGRAGR